MRLPELRHRPHHDPELSPQTPIYLLDAPMTQVETGIPEDARLQERSWYKQADMVTCVPWAVGNAALALGLPLPSETVATLEKIARKRKFLLMQGSSLETTKKTLDLHPESGIVATHPTSNEKLLTLLQTDVLATTAQEQKQHTTLGRTKIIHNARVIHDIVTSGRVSIIAVQSNLGYTPDAKRDETDGHAVTVAGYMSDKNGYFTVQIVDSYSGGSLLVPIEALSGALLFSEKQLIISPIHQG